MGSKSVLGSAYFIIYYYYQLFKSIPAAAILAALSSHSKSFIHRVLDYQFFLLGSHTSLVHSTTQYKAKGISKELGLVNF